MDIEQIAARLREVHGDAVRDVHAEGGSPWIEIDPDEMAEVCLSLRDEDDLDFDRLLFVAGVDHEGYDANGKGKHRKINQYDEDGTVGDAGEPGTADLGVSYFIQSRRHMHSCVLKVTLERDTPRVESVAAIWPTAEWGERETYDMYGIDFEGHPDLRRILLPEDWEGWPLRKDYAMPVRYHDVPLEGMPLAVREKQQVDVASTEVTPTTGDEGTAEKGTDA